MYRTCIKSFSLYGLIFAEGCEYFVEYNSCNGMFQIYHPFGTVICVSNYLLSNNFM